jgi:hypothetical protein
MKEKVPIELDPDYPYIGIEYGVPWAKLSPEDFRHYSGFFKIGVDNFWQNIVLKSRRIFLEHLQVSEKIFVGMERSLIRMHFFYTIKEIFVLFWKVLVSFGEFLIK